MMVRTLDEVLIGLLGAADGVPVELDEARAVAGRPFHVVASDLGTSVERRRLPGQRARTARQILDPHVARRSRRV